MQRKGIRFKVSLVVEAEFVAGITEKDACAVVEEAVSALVANELTGRRFTKHGGDLHGVEVKLKDFDNFTAELE